jgi:hypothetical protein
MFIEEQQPASRNATRQLGKAARTVTQEHLDELYKAFSRNCGGRKEDYFGIAYISAKFNVPPSQVISNVAFGGTEFGIDGYYLDRSSSTLYIFAFRWSDDHLSFKEPLDRLGSKGLDKIFANLSKSPDDPPMITLLRDDLYHNWKTINRVVIEFVFNGDPVNAEQSKVLGFLRETVEDKRGRIESYFSRIDRPDAIYDIIFRYVSNKRSLGHSSSSRDSAEYAIDLGETLMTSGKDKEMMVAMVPLGVLYRMYSDLGERFFEKNIRSGLGDGTMTNDHIKKSLHQIASGEEPSEHFTLYHLGITLTAQQLTFDGGRLRIIEPRILNGAQTIKILKQFVDEEQQTKADNNDVSSPPGAKGIEGNNSLLARTKVMARIIKTSNNEFLRRVTINNNRQNPIMPWNLRANDLVQVGFEELFAKLGIYYERRENAYKNSTDEDLEAVGVDRGGVIEIKRFAQTLLAIQGHIDRMSEIKEVFENEVWYRDTFKERYLEVDPRKLVLLYKIQFRLPSVIREIKSLGTEKYGQISKAKNLLWCLSLQALMNDSKFSKYVEYYGASAAGIEAGLTQILKTMATSKLRFILSDVFENSKYRSNISAGRLSFMSSKTLLNNCLEIARERFGWEKLYL